MTAASPATDGTLLSIVSVTFNDEAGLRRTLNSLAPATASIGSSIEVLVKDGGSDYDWDGLRADFPGVVWLSSDDEGIYDAMNVGMAAAKGRYLWFLNGGDVSLVEDWSAFEEELDVSNAEVMLFAYRRIAGNGSEVRNSRPMRSIWHSLPTSHQAILYRRSSLRGLKYRSDGRFIVSDYEFTAKLYAARLTSSRSRRLLAGFHLGGTSTEHRRQIASQAAEVQRETLRSPLMLRVLSSALHRLARLRAWLLERAS